MDPYWIGCLMGFLFGINVTITAVNIIRALRN